MKKKFPVMALAVFCVFLSGCPIPPADLPPDDEPDPGIAQVDDLFVDNGGGEYEFETNDTAYWGINGYTLWAIKGLPQEPFDHRQVEMNKVEGDSLAGYGIVFCHYTHADPNVGETMLVVMINTVQEYIVGEVCGPDFTEIVPWTTTANLTAGHNQANVLRVEYDDSDPTQFNLYINGVFTDDFHDQEPPYHAGGADGYIVVISPNDDFPNALVHVIFKEQ